MPRLTQLAGVAIALLGITAELFGQIPPPSPAPSPPPSPLTLLEANRMPINLPTALQLAQVRPIDISVASVRLEAALAQQERARNLWLPNIQAGIEYARHDGQIQDVVGNVFPTSKQSMLFGFGPTAVFSVSEAIHGPLAARQVTRARQAEVQIAVNDSFVAVAEAYFNVQQARGDVAGSLESLQQADELVRRTVQLAPGEVPPSEANRARTELARRKQALFSAQERWRTASAELTRLLRLESNSVVDPLEPPDLELTLIDLNQSDADLIALALTNRPELAAAQALVQASLQRVKQERQRPLMPNVLLRGNATNPAGTLSGGSFGGGVNGDLGKFGYRYSFDLQEIWELQNLGLTYRANVHERRAENEQAAYELARTAERIAAEVVAAHVQAKVAAARQTEAAEELRLARETLDQSLKGMIFRRVRDTMVLYVRPAEAVAAVQGLAQAFVNYYSAVADYNRAQCRLYRALGNPAQYINLHSAEGAKK
jgi:outer membrane protein TolC